VLRVKKCAPAAPAAVMCVFFSSGKEGESKANTKADESERAGFV